MTNIVIDNMDTTSAWHALAADGVTPSTEIAIVDDTGQAWYKTDAGSGRITASVNAQGHMLRRNLANVDLSDYTHLHLWLKSKRTADGSMASPFFFEVRLASAAVGINNPANTWLRLLPVWNKDSWESVRLSVDDLPIPIRSAVNLLQIRCVDSSTAFESNIDQVLAVSENSVHDIDSAFLAKLHNQFDLNGTLVPASVYVPGTPVPGKTPHILIRNYDIRYSDERTKPARVRSDFTGDSYRIRQNANAYDLYYAIEVLATDREEQAKIYEFIMKALKPRGDFLVNGNVIQYETFIPLSLNIINGFSQERAYLHYSVWTWQQVDSWQLVKPTEEVVVTVNSKIG